MFFKPLILIILMSLPDKSEAKTCVVLLHGLARTDHSMTKLEKTLSQAGFNVVNQAYDSTKKTIDVLSRRAISAALVLCEESEKVHFVTHSMGGILVRHYLAQHNVPNLGRVVMLGPPNQGSQVVDKLKNVPGFKWFNGPAGLQLGTNQSSVPNTLGPVDFELGVIAGTRSINLILSRFLPSPNDGKVSVASTRVDGMSDHISLAVTHTFMMRNDVVINQVLSFIEQGSFSRN